MNESEYILDNVDQGWQGKGYYRLNYVEAETPKPYVYYCLLETLRDLPYRVACDRCDYHKNLILVSMELVVPEGVRSEFVVYAVYYLGDNEYTCVGKDDRMVYFMDKDDVYYECGYYDMANIMETTTSRRKNEVWLLSVFIDVATAQEFGYLRNQETEQLIAA